MPISDEAPIMTDPRKTAIVTGASQDAAGFTRSLESACRAVWKKSLETQIEKPHAEGIRAT
jgi:hypothetical protein